MARRPRIYIPEVSVHVIQRGNNRGAIVRDDIDRQVFISYLRRASQQHGLSVHGFSLMKTHYHLIVTPPNARSLPETIKSLGVRYVHYFNRRYERVGTLWCARYRGLAITDERYWLTCLRYIEQNPVRAGIVSTPGEYPWSSYAVNGNGAESDWLTPHRVYLELGSTPAQRQVAYRAICGIALNEAETVQQRHGWGLTGDRPGVRLGTDPQPTPSADPGAPAPAPAAASSFLPHSRSSP